MAIVTVSILGGDPLSTGTMTNDKAPYWNALAEADVEAFEDLLRRHPEFVEASVQSSPWKLKIDPSFPAKSRAIHFCSLAGREALLEVLLKHRPDLEVKTFEENKGLTTPLVLASWEGSLSSCRLLLEAGANPNSTASAESPLYAAAEHHAWDKVDLLLQHGAAHDVFTASICGRLDLVSAELTAYRPLAKRRSLKRHRTPLEEAEAHGRSEIVDWIRSNTMSESREQSL